jgi:hypothetical protein
MPQAGNFIENEVLFVSQSTAKEQATSVRSSLLVGTLRSPAVVEGVTQ